MRVNQRNPQYWPSNVAQHLFDLPGHIVDRRHAVYRPQRAPGAIVSHQRGGLLVVDAEPVAHRLFVVVGAADKLGRTAGIADAFGFGFLENIVVALAAFGAGVTPGDADSFG